MKKILTVSIAAYNVEKFLNKTLDSLIIDNMDYLEVLIVNDGSKDKTASIAKKYCKKYPNTFKLINKKNGGYGSTINIGIKNATGKYFKQLDGDDWYNSNELEIIINKLKIEKSDVVYTPFIIYSEVDESTQISGFYEEEYSGKIDSFLKNAGRMNMHSLMFKTSILKNNNITIDEHCFYTDVEYVLYPLLYCDSITVLKEPLYVYRIGRDEQSVSKQGKLKHYKDHIRMSKNILNIVPSIEKLSKNKRRYFENYIAEIETTTINGFLMLLKSNRDNYLKIQEFDSFVKSRSENIYFEMNNYAKTISIIRKNNYLLYKLLKIYKNIKGD